MPSGLLLPSSVGRVDVSVGSEFRVWPCACLRFGLIPPIKAIDVVDRFGPMPLVERLLLVQGSVHCHQGDGLPSVSLQEGSLSPHFGGQAPDKCSEHGVCGILWGAQV
jgi:hypothetical protein